jgi:hypothetical protein
MISSRRALCAAALAISTAFAMSANPHPVKAAPSGAGWTVIIVAGAIAVYELGYRLPADNAKLKGAWYEAEQVTGATYDSATVGVYSTPMDEKTFDNLAPTATVAVLYNDATPQTTCVLQRVRDGTAPIAAGTCGTYDGKTVRIRYVAGGQYKLDDIRAQAIQTLIGVPKTKDNPTWRKQYATLQSCWNKLIFADPAPTPPPSSTQTKATDTPAPTAAPTKKPTPAPTPPIAAKECAYALAIDAGQAPAIVSDNAPIAYVDLIEANDAFNTAPSLRQQILNRRVGPNLITNLSRAEVLARLAGVFYLSNPLVGVKKITYYSGIYHTAPGETPAPTATAVSLTNIYGGLTSCVSKFSPSDCFSNVQAIEQTIISGIAAQNACAFATDHWLPPINAIGKTYGKEMAASTKPIDTDSQPSLPTIEQIQATRFVGVPQC